MITLGASESVICILYHCPLSAVNVLSRLTKLTTSKGAVTADSIRKFSNRPVTFESNRTADSNSNRISTLRRSLKTIWKVHQYAPFPFPKAKIYVESLQWTQFGHVFLVSLIWLKKIRRRLKALRQIVSDQPQYWRPIFSGRKIFGGPAVFGGWGVYAGYTFFLWPVRLSVTDHELKCLHTLILCMTSCMQCDIIGKQQQIDKLVNACNKLL